tara:strand:+ start:6619 stop:7080 length:462 start_codon:yes stop_codon:yes gene_type:complete
MPRDIVWKAYEHSHTNKGADWFWALGIIAVSSAIVAILFKNFLFALLIIVGAFTMALLSSKPPRERTFALTQRGVMVDESLYPYQMLVAFCIKDRDSDNPTLIIDAQHFLTPHLVMPLAEVDVERVHTYLSEHLSEEELEEPLGQRLLERFGF